MEDEDIGADIRSAGGIDIGGKDIDWALFATVHTNHGWDPACNTSEVALVPATEILPEKNTLQNIELIDIFHNIWLYRLRTQ